VAKDVADEQVDQRWRQLFGRQHTEPARPPSADGTSGFGRRLPEPFGPGPTGHPGGPAGHHAQPADAAAGEPVGGFARGAFDPGRRGVRALAAVAAVVVVAAGFLAWQSRPRTEPVGAAAGPGASGTAIPAADVSRPATLVVAVTGRVRRPGLVQLLDGARVADAIDAAGGVLPDTDLSVVNLARRVVDGELIAIGVPGVPAGGGAPGAPGAPTGKVNLNTATLAQLDALPGVGPVLAQRIIDHRTRRGQFRSVGDLRQVEGIGDAKYDQLKELVTV
jgi:competence protein ComEA